MNTRTGSNWNSELVTRTGGHLALGDDGSEDRDETQACRVLGDFDGVFSFSIARKNDRKDLGGHQRFPSQLD